jgi:hypothetical protein
MRWQQLHVDVGRVGCTKLKSSKVANFFLGTRARAARVGRTDIPSYPARRPRQRPPPPSLRLTVSFILVRVAESCWRMMRSCIFSRSWTILQVNNSSMVMHPINSLTVQPMSAISPWDVLRLEFRCNHSSDVFARGKECCSTYGALSSSLQQEVS